MPADFCTVSAKLTELMTDNYHNVRRQKYVSNLIPKLVRGIKSTGKRPLMSTKLLLVKRDMKVFITTNFFIF